jgi:hypothetical protein
MAIKRSGIRIKKKKDSSNKREDRYQLDHIFLVEKNF